MRPCEDDDHSRWPAHDRMLTWRRRQTEVTAHYRHRAPPASGTFRKCASLEDEMITSPKRLTKTAGFLTCFLGSVMGSTSSARDSSGSQSALRSFSCSTCLNFYVRVDTSEKGSIQREHTSSSSSSEHSMAGALCEVGRTERRRPNRDLCTQQRASDEEV